MPALGRGMQGEMRRGGVPAVHAGFREACRELRGEGDPRGEERGYKVPAIPYVLQHFFDGFPGICHNGHIDLDVFRYGRRVYVNMDDLRFRRERVELSCNTVIEPRPDRKEETQIKDGKAEHPLAMKKKPVMTPQDILDAINEMFEECIIVTDVGQHQMFVSQFAEVTERKRLLMSGGLGTMGYGLPGAIGAQIGNPDVPVISISGDGGMQMDSPHRATAIFSSFHCTYFHVLLPNNP